MVVAKTLKAQNIGWIWAVVVADALALIAFGYPAALEQDVFSSRSILKLLGVGVAPVVVLLLTSLLPSAAKVVLVYWRIRHSLPGHRAFSVHATSDPRIDLQALKKNVGTFPEDPRKQNTLWYRLFKKVDTEITVAQPHRHYLLFRDVAAMSFLLCFLAPLALWILGAPGTTAGFASGLFTLQYVATAIAARNEGNRLVCNVLALHSVKRRA